MTDVQCVGFVECPCKACRTRRKEATEEHRRFPMHDDPYCGACRTQRLRDNYASRFVKRAA